MEETSWRNLTAEVPLLLAAALISYLSFLVVLYSAELLPTITNAMNVFWTGCFFLFVLGQVRMCLYIASWVRRLQCKF